MPWRWHESSGSGTWCCSLGIAILSLACMTSSYRFTHPLSPLFARNAEPSDLQYLTEENIEEIGAALTHVERMRLQAALQALRNGERALLV